jgi:hypothetical protein
MEGAHVAAGECTSECWSGHAILQIVPPLHVSKRLLFTRSPALRALRAPRAPPPPNNYPAILSQT